MSSLPFFSPYFILYNLVLCAWFLLPLIFFCVVLFSDGPQLLVIFLWMHYFFQQLCTFGRYLILWPLRTCAVMIMLPEGMFKCRVIHVNKFMFMQLFWCRRLVLRGKYVSFINYLSVPKLAIHTCLWPDIDGFHSAVLKRCVGGLYKDIISPTY